MKLGEMTWPEVKALDKSNLVAIYPIAAFEQHGPHLPFLTDTMETDEIVERLNGRLPDDVVCLPTQWVGYSFHHMRFAGSVTATSETHINLIYETVGCVLQAGFPKVLIVNGHGGNQPDMAVSLQKLKECYPDPHVFAVSHWKAAEQELDKIREAGPDGYGHAGEMETSLMMALRPDLVKADLPGKDGTRPDSEYRSSVSQILRMDEKTEKGVYGDPSFGSAEKGERMFEAIIDSLVEIVRDIQSGRL